MQGTIVKFAVAEGDIVEVGQTVVVLEAMKMEQPLAAHKAGRVTGFSAEPGATVSAGTVICQIVDVEDGAADGGEADVPMPPAP
jgi:acetyl-CoA/propionyl-CoA carboxylase biotin carboxyl carrier protein